MYFSQTLIAVVILLGVFSDSILRLKRIFKEQEEVPEPIVNEFNRLWEADRSDREAWEAEYRKQVGPLPTDPKPLPINYAALAMSQQLNSQQQSLAHYNMSRQLQAMQDQSNFSQFRASIDPVLLAQLLGGPKC